MPLCDGSNPIKKKREKRKKKKAWHGYDHYFIES